MRKLLITAGVAAAILAAAGQAAAAEVTVRMLNKGAQGMMVFEPATAELKPGDTVRFVPTDPGHYAETIPGMLPAGAAPFKSAVNKEAVVKLDKPGVYGFKCPPHWGFGMSFVARVGKNPPNLAAAEAAAAKAPGMAKKRLAAMFQQLNGQPIAVASAR